MIHSNFPGGKINYFKAKGIANKILHKNVSGVLQLPGKEIDMRTKRKFRPEMILLEAFTAALLMVCALQASVVRFMPFGEQVSAAEVIVVARAVSQVSSWDSQERFIFTETTFRIEEAVKGTASGTVTLSLLGGQVSEIAQSVAGSPVVIQGRSYVLFLEPRIDGTYRVVGFNQGCYPIAGSAKSRAMVMTRTAAAGAEKPISDQRDYILGSMSLDEFLSRIRMHMEGESE